MRKKDKGKWKGKGKGTGKKKGKRKEKEKGVKMESRMRIGVDINNDEKMKKVWNKKSIFFQLEYWKHLLLRHNLDIMHIEEKYM